MSQLFCHFKSDETSTDDSHLFRIIRNHKRIYCCCVLDIADMKDVFHVSPFNWWGGWSSTSRKDQCIIIVLFRLTGIDRKSTRLNSSHVSISYAVFCL